MVTAVTDTVAIVVTVIVVVTVGVIVLVAVDVAVTDVVRVVPVVVVSGVSIHVQTCPMTALGADSIDCHGSELIMLAPVPFVVAPVVGAIVLVVLLGETIVVVFVGPVPEDRDLLASSRLPGEPAATVTMTVD